MGALRAVAGGLAAGHRLLVMTPLAERDLGRLGAAWREGPWTLDVSLLLAGEELGHLLITRLARADPMNPCMPALST